MKHPKLKEHLYSVTVAFQSGYKVTIDNVESYEVTSTGKVSLDYTEYTEQFLALCKPTYVSCVTHRLVVRPEVIKLANELKAKQAKEAAAKKKVVKPRRKRTIPKKEEVKKDE